MKNKVVTEITPPFFVFDGLDLSIYDSLDSIEVDLEGVDVEAGIYEAFDAIGRVVRLKATGVKRGKFIIDIGETHVDTVEPTPTGAERLFRLLFDHLREIGHAAPQGVDLADLVAECLSAHSQKR